MRSSETYQAVHAALAKAVAEHCAGDVDLAQEWVGSHLWEIACMVDRAVMESPAGPMVALGEIGSCSSLRKRLFEMGPDSQGRTLILAAVGAAVLSLASNDSAELKADLEGCANEF